MSEAMLLKDCPHCFNKIDEKASVCPVCQREIASKQDHKDKRRRNVWIGVIFLVVIFLCLAIWILTSTGG